MNIETLKTLAARLMFDMKDEEYETLQKEFEIILKQMDLIGNILNIEKIEPMTHPFLLENVKLREDEITERLTEEELLLNVKNEEYGMVKVPKVVE